MLKIRTEIYKINKALLDVKPVVCGFYFSDNFWSLNRPILLYVFKYAACTSATCQINYNFKNVQASQNTNLTILQITKALKKSSTKWKQMVLYFIEIKTN